MVNPETPEFDPGSLSGSSIGFCTLVCLPQTPLARMIKCGFAPMLWATIMHGQEAYNYTWNRVYNIILRVLTPSHGSALLTNAAEDFRRD